MEQIKKSKSLQEIQPQFLQKVMASNNLPAEQISYVFMSLSLTSVISFYEHELTVKEFHDLSVCIPSLTRGTLIDNVLVDTRASACVVPMTTLRRYEVKETNKSNDAISVSAFDNFK